MILLSQSKHTELVYLIRGSAYPWLYSKLSQILNAEEICYFASIEIRQTEGRWSAFHEGDFMSYSKITEADREYITDDLNYLHTVVRGKIAADPDMKRYVNELLVVPSQEQIFVYHDKSGLPKITLSQWGCSLPRSKHGFDPIGLIIEERKKTHTLVDIALKWTNGEPAANIKFRFAYKYSVLEKTTNSDGLARLGLLKNGLPFTLSDITEPASFEETLEVVPDQSLYTIAIPYYTSVEVKVIDQTDQPVAGCSIKTLHNDDDSVFSTDEHGVFQIERILHDNNPLILSLLPDNKLNREYTLEHEHNRLTFKIYRTITANVRIKIINRSDSAPVPEHAIGVKFPNEECELTSDSEGVVTLNGIEVSTKFVVTDASDEYNYQDFTVVADATDFVFPVELPVILAPQIKVVNRKDDVPVGAYPLKVKINGNEHELYSNREGIVALADVKQGCKMLVTDTNDPYNNAEFAVDIDATEFIFHVELPEIFTQRIKVVNRDDNSPAGAYPLKITVADGSEQELYSNRDGFILLADMKKDTRISLIDGNDPYNNAEFTSDAEMEEYLFPVKLPEEKMIRINLIDRNKEIMPNHIIDVIINGIHYRKTTDDEGKILLSASLFTHGEKVKVQIPITENDKKKKSDK